MDTAFPDPVSIWRDTMMAREASLEALRGEVFELTGMAFDEIEHTSVEQLKEILRKAKEDMKNAKKNAPQSEA